MFFSDPIFDMQVTLGIMALGFCISMVVFLVKRNIWLAGMIFSIIGNMAFLLALLLHSRMFQFYHILWMYSVSIGVWPLCNLLWIVFYVRNKKI